MDKTIEQQARESIKAAIERQLNEQLFGAPAGTMTQETLAIGRVRAVIAGLRSGAYSGAGASDKIADELQAAIRALTAWNTRPAPTEAEVEAAAVLDAVIREMDTDEKGKPYVYTKPSMVIWTDKWRGWVARLRMARAALEPAQPASI